MKKFLLLLTSSLFATSLAMSVWADQGYGSPATGMGKMEKMDKMEHKMKGWHKMYGDISSIDYAKGTLTVNNSEAKLTLHFPPALIKDLKIGDFITVGMGFERGSGVE